ncbi:MAG: 1-deoxy-D-xylulose-5-phosphate reductoisomerase [Dehalococcoidia bacterium]|nr:1-deoxy-D-xylulose-5-phosphate reductoisomerase [Dehalococcoidia bacterium]
MDRVRKIVLLGSTGSIGQQTLDVVRAFPDCFEVTGLAGGRNGELLGRQIEEFHPKVFFSQAGVEVGCEGEFLSMEEMSCLPEVDLVIVATSGKAGLNPTLSAIKAGKTVALADKEVLVMAGEIISSEAALHSVRLLPIDSEHNAVWQCLQGEDTEIYRILLTASGGPFYGYSQSRLEAVTVEQALRHPTWKMGKKVTIDSATLMNKGLEVIEAHWLFGVPFEKIKVLVHRQSIIHSLVEFADGSIKAQLGATDMRLPIQCALMFPHRPFNDRLPRLEWTKLHTLTLEEIDYDKFPCLKLALDAGKKGGTYPSVLCAADEIATKLFLEREVAFTDIARIVQMTLEQHQGIAHPSMEEILAADAWARNYAASVIKILGTAESAVN